MNEVKGILESKSVWGALLAIAGTVASLLGYDIGDTNGLANEIVVLVGSVVAIYGRVKAVKRLGA